MENISGSKDRVIDQIVQKLFETRDEIEKLASELSTDESDATHQFEHVLTAFREELKALRELIPDGSDGDAVRLAVGDLEESLAALPHPTPAAVVPQTQNLMISLKKVEVNPNHALGHAIVTLEHEVEKLKLKARIISLKMALGKFIVSDYFRDHMKQASSKIENITSNVTRKITNGKKVVASVREESAHVYKALRKAVDSLSK